MNKRRIERAWSWRAPCPNGRKICSPLRQANNVNNVRDVRDNDGQNSTQAAISIGWMCCTARLYH